SMLASRCMVARGPGLMRAVQECCSGAGRTRRAARALSIRAHGARGDAPRQKSKVIMSDPAFLIKRARPLLLWALGTLGATALHHVYGAIRYASPWRMHAAVIALLL